MTGLLARGGVSEAERVVFQAVNELPESLHPFIWPLMQYGTFITIPVLAVVAFCFRRFRLGIALLLAGVGVYLIALLVKATVERQRPGSLLDGVEARESFAPRASATPRATRRWPRRSPWWLRPTSPDDGRSRRRHWPSS